MQIKNKEIKLGFNVSLSLCYDSEEVIYDTFRDEVKEYLNVIKFIDGDVSTLNDFDFYNLLTSLYDITLEGEDWLEIFSKAKDREYNRYEIVKTNMCFEVGAECGNSLKVQQLYDVAVAKDYTSKIKSNITLSSLQKLASISSIIVVASKSTFVSKLPGKPRKMNEFPTIELLNSEEFFGVREYKLLTRDNDNLRKLEVYPYLIDFLRSKVSDRNILVGMKIFGEELNKQIKDVVRINYQVCKDCKKWFDSSEEKMILEKVINQPVNK